MYSIQLSQSALFHNLDTFRSQISADAKLLGVIKANAYGHGLKEISEILEGSKKVDVYGVVSIDEALELRRLKRKLPILVMGYTEPERILEAVEHDIMLTVFQFEMLEEYEDRLSKPQKSKNHKPQTTDHRLQIHLKFDTGLHRLGWFEEDALGVVLALKSCKHLEVVGIFSHLASAENPGSVQTQKQIKIFDRIVDEVSKNLKIKYIHLGASSASLIFPEAHFNMVRIGIGMYGLWPSDETKHVLHYSDRADVQLQPVLSYATKIIQIKEMDMGELLGYGGTFRSVRLTKIAIIPVGYAEGFPRVLSNKGEVLVRGQRVPIIGRICMNMTMLDVTDVPAVAGGDEVILIGEQGEQKITVDDWAEWGGTINYEIVAKLPANISKKIVT